MVFKFVTLFALVAAGAKAGFIPAAPTAYASPLAYAAAPIAKTVLTKTIDADYDSHPQYNYAYDVQDSLTGDFKSQHESRDGDVVHGSYSLLESDGTRRIVDYSADSVNGFNAVVRKEPAQIAVKTVAAAPLAVKALHASPIAYAAPVAHAAYAAPVAHATYAAPVAHATYAAPVAHATYAAPVAHATYAAPGAYAAHATYAAPALAKFAAPAPYAAYAASPAAYYH